MSDITILAILTSVFIGAGFGVIIYAFRNLDELHFYFAMLAAWALLLFGLAIGIITFEQHAYGMQLHKAEEMLENGCKAYVDGQEVNTDYIDLERYEIVIKNENILLYEK